MAATVADLAARALRRLGVAAVAAADRPALTADPLGFAEIGRLALEWLGVTAADEAPAAADAARAEGKARSVHAGLVAQGIASWGGDGQVPRWVSEDVVMLTALHLAPTFGKPGADPEAAARVEARIRRKALVAGAQALAEQAVMAVHAWLDARGVARWGVFDIPDFAEDPYVALAAARLASAFEVAPDPLAETRALRELAQATALPSSGETLAAAYF